MKLRTGLWLVVGMLTFVIAGCGASPGTGDTTSASSLSGKVRVTAKVSIASGKPSSETVNATVYAIGQESNKATTNSNGEFTLLIDAKQSGTVLQKSGALPHAAATPANNQYGIIVASGTGGYGKKIEITGNDGDDVTLPSPVEITEVGSISGTVTLQNQTDNTGTMIYIPGTSFMALTDASGSFTINGVPEGTYLILRAEKNGYNYSALSDITVLSGKSTTVANQMLLISTGASGSILINHGAAVSTSSTVDINVSATDNAVLMTIAEEPTFQNTSWTTLQSYTTHTFTLGGDKTLYIKFADANGLESTPYSDSITIDTNPRVTLSFPLGTISLTKPTLTWTASSLPNPKYHVQVSASSAFGVISEEATNLTSASYTLTKNLSNATTYYWRVSTIDENVKEWNWCDTGQFAIDLSTVTLISPANASYSNDTTPTFNWSANSNAATYNLVLSTNSDLSSPVVDKTGITATSYTDPAPLANTAGIIYYWAVTPVDTNGVAGTRSTIYSFTLDTTAPVGSITINNGDTSTTSTAATLGISATDSMGIKGYCSPTESSTTPSSTDTCWTSITSTTNYSTTTSYTMSSGSGIKNVYIWFKDSAGNVSLAASDSIGLAPSAPTGVSAAAGNTQATVSWTAVTGATSYNVYYSATAGVTTSTGTKVANATSGDAVTGLTNGTTYYFIVTAVNLGGESIASSQVSAMPQLPASFGAATNYTAGTNPESVAIGDLNGDGKPDLTVANSGSNNVSVLLGTGTGTFGAATNFAVVKNPWAVAIGDLNGDGKPDLAVTNMSNDASNGIVSILLGDGTGSFGAATNYTAGVEVRSVAIGDLNGDGNLDLAVTNSTTMISGNVAILLGDGTGFFGTATNYTAGLDVRSVAIGDLNGDGKPDLSVAISNGNVSILLGTGIGTFGAATNYTAGLAARSVASKDLNGDGNLDLVVTNENYGTVSVLLGSGTGSFGVATNFAVGIYPWAVAIGDLNGDGKPDLAVTYFLSSNVSVLLGTGTGTFGAATDFAVGMNPRSVAIGDLNGDGKPDLAAANQGSGTVSILLNQ